VAVRDTGLKIEQTSDDFRFAAAVACFGMLLRDSEHKGSATIKLASSLARAALGSDPHRQRHELVQLLDQAASVGVGSGERKATAQVAK
jgi:Ca-activated chloride channel family protein